MRLQFGWMRAVGRPMFEKRLLVWDAFRCHTSEATKKVLRDLDLHTAVISGVCTKFVQAHIRCYYETWISNGDRMTFTTGGNLRARSMEVYLDWIVRAWDALPKNQVISPFKEEEDVEEDLANSYLSVEDEVIEEEILFEL
uniref:DDE-1 domain-containing protein n=1 Tax=Ditylenchus dipsaci TaxID=166011 RepID=A0A915E952_9BILA